MVFTVPTSSGVQFSPSSLAFTPDDWNYERSLQVGGGCLCCAAGGDDVVYWLCMVVVVVMVVMVVGTEEWSVCSCQVVAIDDELVDGKEEIVLEWPPAQSYEGLSSRLLLVILFFFMSLLRLLSFSWLLSKPSINQHFNTFSFVLDAQERLDICRLYARASENHST